jgi:hypothetical protein
LENKQTFLIMTKAGYRIVFIKGTYAQKRQGHDQPGLDLERALVDFVLAKGLATNPSGDCCNLSNKFRTTQTLAGATTITHNLKLTDPFATIIDVRVAGVAVPFTVVSETANEVIINATATNAVITII